ncbi:hypothetical protein FRB99_000207 [Tulasnella sp. 403]|nr:hypothetical protein FRB99_000207 [Tulasnella sp. 403]
MAPIIGDPTRPLRLLSLDGGGVRGIMSLVILQEILNKVEGNGGKLRPCQYFDVIGGTSTGGLIAIMLGRLCMTVPECISAYSRFAKDVFDVNPIVQGVSLLKAHRFSGAKLEEVVKAVVQEQSGWSSQYMRHGDEKRDGISPCRAYVVPDSAYILPLIHVLSFAVAMPAGSSNGPPKLFRTYDNPSLKRTADTCFIWEAARATSCAPSFFPPITVQNVSYMDGGLGYNNPARLLLQEADWLSPGRPVQLYSLGTGKVQPTVGQQFKHPWDLLKIPRLAISIANDCERVHGELRDQIQTDVYRPRPTSYHRYDPTMDKMISLDEWKKLDYMTQIALDYIEKGQQEVVVTPVSPNQEQQP